MTTPDSLKGLAERLRVEATSARLWGLDPVSRVLLSEAADAILALRSENARLRAVVEQIAAGRLGAGVQSDLLIAVARSALGVGEQTT